MASSTQIQCCCGVTHKNEVCSACGMPRAASKYFFASAGNSAKWHYLLCMGASLGFFVQEMFYADFTLFPFPADSTNTQEKTISESDVSYTITSSGMPQWLTKTGQTITPPGFPKKKSERARSKQPEKKTDPSTQGQKDIGIGSSIREPQKAQQPPQSNRNKLWQNWPEQAIIDYGTALEVGNACKRSRHNSTPVLPFPVTQLQSTIRFMLGYYAGETPTPRQSAQAIHQTINIRKAGEKQRISFSNILNHQLNQLQKQSVEKISVFLSSAGVKGMQLEMNMLCIYEFREAAHQTVCRKAKLTLDENGRIETIESIMSSAADSEEEKFGILKLSEGFDYYPYPDNLIIEHKL